MAHAYICLFSGKKQVALPSVLCYIPEFYQIERDLAVNPPPLQDDMLVRAAFASSSVFLAFCTCPYHEYTADTPPTHPNTHTRTHHAPDMFKKLPHGTKLVASRLCKIN